MTQYELTDALTSMVHVQIGLFTAYVSLTAAFLVAIYLAGRKLTTAQAMTVGSLYSVAASVLAWGMFAIFSRAVPIADALEKLNPQVNYGAQPLAGHILVGLMSLGIFAALKFAWDIRHS